MDLKQSERSSRSTILLSNIQGLNTKGKFKVQMLKEMMEVELKCNILALTETHLNSEIKDAEIQMEGFQLYRVDRKNRKQGGVALYLRNDIAAETIEISRGSDSYIEHIMVHIKKYNLVVANVYKPPDANSDRLKTVMNLIKEKFLALGNPEPSLVLCGDFNLPRVNWAANSQEYTNAQANYMTQLTEELFLEQIVNVPTREDNILDLCFVNNMDLIVNTEVRKTGMSDHKLVVIDTSLEYKDIDTQAKRECTGLDSLNFFHKRIDWTTIINDLRNVNWVQVLLNKTVDEQNQQLHENIVKVCQQRVPKKKNRSRRKKVPEDRKRLMRTRARIVKKMARDGQSHQRQQKLADIENRLKSSHKKEKENDEKKVIETVDINPKSFFGYVRSLTMTKTSVGPLKRDDDSNELITDHKEM